MSGKGLYGTNQGNKSRGAGRHNGAMIAAEALDISNLLDKDILVNWTGFWQTGSSLSLKEDIDRVRKQWLAGYVPGGELPNGKAITPEVYRVLVEGRISSLITRATFGPCGKGERRRRV